jgi:3-deoxy-manno-octulosonate cytidylyltransferase (CMP-KDO synthetase)
MTEEIYLLKGNEAIAHAAIRYGADGYFGYPITPQSEIMETLMLEAPWKTTGMVVLQAESETASINMVYGGAGCGKAVMTSPLHVNGTERCAEALSLMQKQYGEQADVVVNIQGDEPFTDASLLRRLASCFGDPAVQIATVVCPVDCPDDLFNPNCVKAVISTSGRALYFSRSVIPYMREHEQQQWLQQHIFHHHLGLYAYRANVLLHLTQMKQSPLEMAESLEQNRWLENDCYIQVIQTNEAGISIDTPDDLIRAEKWLETHPVTP